MEMNGGSSAPYLACTPCVPLFCALFLGVETEELLDYQGRAGDHFHCTVEPSPGHIRCRPLPFLFVQNGTRNATITLIVGGLARKGLLAS